MSKGVLYFAKNNARVNHIKLASLSARLAKKHLNVPSCLVTDRNQFDKMDQDIKSSFEEVIFRSFPTPEQKSVIVDGKKIKLDYHNSLRPNAYELSPFDETLLLDTDFIIQTDTLSSIWGCNYPILMNTESRSLLGNKPDIIDRRLSQIGPKIIWATVVFFKKSLVAKEFFSCVQYVRNNYEFYRRSFSLPTHLFRNDYAFSIASHLIGETKNPFHQLPIPIINAYPDDEILSVNSNSISFSTNNYPVRVGLDVHIMNKIDLENKYCLFEGIMK